MPKDKEKALRFVGALIENPLMYPNMTGMENLKYYASLYKNISKNDIIKYSRVVGLEQRLKDKVKTYSLGMKQRLGIAQALLHSPKLLILDEPLSGLDPNGVKEIDLYTFNSCDKLTSVTIPSGIKNLHTGAFSFDINLETIIFKGTINEWNSIVKGNNWMQNVPAKEVSCSDGIISLAKTITFTINDAPYEAKEGMTWGGWILSTGSSTDNGIVWVGYDNRTIYLDIDYPNHVIARPGDDEIICLNGIIQTVHNKIIEGANYQTKYYECCFDAGSQVLMADGTTKNIEDVQVGDVVMSLNEDTGEYVAQEVAKTIIKHNSDDLVYINLSNGVQIGMRAYHPLLTTEGWKSLRPGLAETIVDVGYVELLKVGDVLVGYDENVTIVSIEIRPAIENYDTYNLSIDGYHNYIVNGVVVHNAGCPT
jgi:hypothetical protein